MEWGVIVVIDREKKKEHTGVGAPRCESIYVEMNDEEAEAERRNIGYICYATVETTSMTHKHTDWAHTAQHRIMPCKTTQSQMKKNETEKERKKRVK